MLISHIVCIAHAIDVSSQHLYQATVRIHNADLALWPCSSVRRRTRFFLVLVCHDSTLKRVVQTHPVLHCVRVLVAYSGMFQNGSALTLLKSNSLSYCLIQADTLMKDAILYISRDHQTYVDNMTIANVTHNSLM